MSKSQSKLPVFLPQYRASVLLGISVKSLRALVRAGKIPVEKVGKSRVKVVVDGLCGLYGRELLESRAHLLKAKN